MICYAPFWKTLKAKNITVYKLIRYYNMSSGTFYRMRKNMPISSHTLNRLCYILKCNIEDIAEYVSD